MGSLIHNDHPTGQAWRECDLCGFEYPEAMLRFRRGRFVCVEHCDDVNLRVEYEPFETKRRLEDKTFPEWPRK